MTECNSFVQGWLGKIEATLSTLWSKRQVAEKVDALLPYRSELNTHLNNLINAQTSNAAPNRITEVLSVSQNFDANLRSIATSLTEPITKSTTAAAASGRGKSIFGDHGTSVIRYNLIAADNLAQDGITPLLEPAPDFIQEMLKALSFDEADDREYKVAKAHQRTYSWIWHEQSPFRFWLQGDDPLFWISGKAGSGKSTLMKYIVQNQLLDGLLRPWTASRQLIIARFFFWYAGQPLQKSHEGILRSLLHQIFKKRPDMIPVAFPRLCGRILQRHAATDRGLYKFPLSELTEAFARLTSNFLDVAFCIVIDGVDEFSGDHYDFSRFLVQTANGTTVKMIVSSRPIPMCCQVFSSFPSLKLQDLTEADIKAYIEDKLLHNELLVEMNDLEEGFADEVEMSLVEKASGVFLWIVLVVRSLLIGLGNYEDRHVLMAKIDELPTDLENLYHHMFGKMSSAYQCEGSKLLQLAIFAKEVQPCSFTALQLFVANNKGVDVDLSDEAISYPMDQENLRIKRIEGQLRSRCCGLLEVEFKGVDGLPNEPKIGFLHRTVYDYLRNEDVSNKLEELYELGVQEANLVLLASCTYLIKRRVKFPKSFSLDHHLQGYFATCLKCSLYLQKVRDERYVHYLSIADTEYTSCCIPENSCYYRAYEMIHKTPSCIDESFVTQNAGMMTTALFKIARMNLPLYFAKKITSACTIVADKSLVLLYLLNWSRCASDADMLLCVKNVNAILDAGVHPLDPSTRTINKFSPEAFRHSCLLEGYQFSARSAVPWRFWLTVCEHRTEHAKITLLLVEAAAKLHFGLGPNLSAAEKDFVIEMKRWRTDCQDAETCLLLDIVIPKLEQRQKRRRYSDEDEIGARPKLFS